MATTATTFSSASTLHQNWVKGWDLAANEESVFTKHCHDYTGEAGDGLANQINISIMGLMGQQTAAAGHVGTGITPTDEGGSNVSATPTFVFSAWYPTEVAISRLASRGPTAIAAAKKQLLSATMTKVDTTGTTLASSLTTSVEGGAVVLDHALMVRSLKDLLVQGKEHAKAGGRFQFLIHPAQADALLSIPTITAANVRGDKANPNVSGWVWDAWGAGIEESGNVLTSAGIAYNMLFIPDKTFGVAYNMKPKLLAPQQEELLHRFISVAEVGFVEVFDYDAVLMKTNDT